MMTGDLVRCRDYRIEETDDWDQIGLVVQYDSLMKMVHVLVQSTGEVKKYRASHTEIIKRAPQNKEILKKLAKNKKIS
tara:strand:+ start:1045 stop:1278 length:234 start_codon:yes stop_codon:yes gene_type:complete